MGGAVGGKSSISPKAHCSYRLRVGCMLKSGEKGAEDESAGAKNNPQLSLQL
jgi:hypothetical protein